jgi:Cu2+-exporting ATPase
MGEIGAAVAAAGPGPAAASGDAAGGSERFAPYVKRAADGTASLSLVVENIHCAACIRRIETRLTAIRGVIAARVNFTTQRLAVSWRPGESDPEALVAALRDLGYRAVPYDPESLADERRGEDRDLLRALGVAGFAAANVMLLSVAVWAGLASDMGEATRGLFHWISALIALPAISYAGRPFFRSAAGALSARHLNMDVPISLAVILAAGLSLYRTMIGEDYVYFDAALMLLFFLLIGRTLDRRMRARARSVAGNLLALQSSTATLIAEDGRHYVVAGDAVRPGARVLVARGERIPVDGRVREGRSEVDSSLVTGESLPGAVGPGAMVYAGTLNLGDALIVETTASDRDTFLAEIVRLMEAAEVRRGRFIGLADRAARIYAPAVHVLAAATFAAWLLFSNLGWEGALMNAVAVLIITCPCALGLAVPVVQVVAVGRLLRGGILVKSGDALERLAEAEAVVFDKTGTLTLGRLVLDEASTLPAADLALAAGMAAASRHPLSRALVEAAGSAVKPHAGVREEPGLGLAANLPEGEARLGSRAWCAISSEADESDTGIGPELWLRRPDGTTRRFCFRDTLRPDAAAAVAHLTAQGLTVELLSGDRAPVVEKVAAALGVADWRAKQSPAQKIARLEALRGSGRKVAMVGDGLNDAPALAAATVSVSPSSAVDVSQTAADLVFQGKSLAPLVELWEVAKSARRLILQNFALAALYNLLAVPLAMAGLVTPLIAAAAMSGSSLVVTLNALRLSRVGHARTTVAKETV